MSHAECNAGRASHGFETNSFKITHIFQSAITIYMRWHKYKMAINDLRTLDNRLLKDIGINRSYVDEAADAFIQHYRGIY